VWKALFFIVLKFIACCAARAAGVSIYFIPARSTSYSNRNIWAVGQFRQIQDYPD